MDGVSFAILGVNLENYTTNLENLKINREILAHAESETLRQTELISTIRELTEIGAGIYKLLKEDKQHGA